MKKITLLILVLVSITAWGSEFPNHVSQRTPRAAEIFKKANQTISKAQSAKNQFRVSQQMYHMWNNAAGHYDTMSLVNYQYTGSTLVQVKETKFYSGSVFVNNERELHYYDAFSRDTSVVYQHYNPALQAWGNFYKMTTKYDARGNVTFVGSYSFLPPAGWTLNYANLIEYEYNTQWQILKITYSTWTGGAWEFSDRELWEYTGGLNSAVVYQIREAGSWVNDARQEYIYTNNVWTQIKFLSWSGTAWVPEYWYKDITWYNFGEMKWTYYLGQEYVMGIWKNFERGYGYYNSAGLPTRVEYQDYVGIVWVNVNRQRWEYDAFNNITLYVDEDWTGTSWAIYFGNKYIFEYNPNNTIAAEYYEEWVQNAKGWVKRHKLQSWYQSITAVSSLDGDASSLSLFPNPVLATLSFLVKETGPDLYFQITDFSGRMVKTGRLGGETGSRHEIDVSGLSSGVYILNVIGSGQKNQQKFIKQ